MPAYDTHQVLNQPIEFTHNLYTSEISIPPITIL